MKDSCYNKLLLSHNIISTNCSRSFSAIIMEPSRCMCTITGNGIINTKKKSFYCFSANLEVIQLSKWISKCLLSALPHCSKMIISMDTHKIEVRGQNSKPSMVLRLKKPRTLSNTGKVLVVETCSVLGLEHDDL